VRNIRGNFLGENVRLLSSLESAVVIIVYRWAAAKCLQDCQYEYPALHANPHT